MDGDLKYYRRRSVEESAAAQRAPNAKVREVHLELARRYDERISALSVPAEKISLHLVG
jgi:hypothetical protein